MTSILEPISGVNARLAFDVELLNRLRLLLVDKLELNPIENSVPGVDASQRDQEMCG